MAKQTQQLVLMLIIGILIGTTAVMAWKMRGVQHEATVASDAERSTPSGKETTTLDGVNRAPTTIAQAIAWPLPPQIPANTRLGLTTPDQSAGSVVNVSDLSLHELHWVGIYDDRDGHPGWIMGAARVHVGDVAAQVELLRPMVSGGTYYATILNDDGDDTFNRLSDLPPLSPDKVVIVSFKAQ